MGIDECSEVYVLAVELTILGAEPRAMDLETTSEFAYEGGVSDEGAGRPARFGRVHHGRIDCAPVSPIAVLAAVPLVVGDPLFIRPDAADVGYIESKREVRAQDRMHDVIISNEIAELDLIEGV
jgi:hypothetical protein